MKGYGEVRNSSRSGGWGEQSAQRMPVSVAPWIASQLVKRVSITTFDIGADSLCKSTRIPSQDGLANTQHWRIPVPPFQRPGVHGKDWILALRFTRYWHSMLVRAVFRWEDMPGGRAQRWFWVGVAAAGGARMAVILMSSAMPMWGYSRPKLALSWLWWLNTDARLFVWPSWQHKGASTEGKSLSIINHQALWQFYMWKAMYFNNYGLVWSMNMSHAYCESIQWISSPPFKQWQKKDVPGTL